MRRLDIKIGDRQVDGRLTVVAHAPELPAAEWRAWLARIAVHGRP
jgi:hypothetical protein